jgi:hypothetical protein
MVEIVDICFKGWWIWIHWWMREDENVGAIVCNGCFLTFIWILDGGEFISCCW